MFGIEHRIRQKKFGFSGGTETGVHKIASLRPKAESNGFDPLLMRL
jgi:hypothetical protein